MCAFCFIVIGPFVGWDIANSTLAMKRKANMTADDHRIWPWAWPWSWIFKVMPKVKSDGHQRSCLLFFSSQSDHFWAGILQISYLALAIQFHGHDQIRWSHLKPRVQSICLLFVSWQSDQSYHTLAEIWVRFFSKFRFDLAENRPKSHQVIYLSRPKCHRNPKSCLEVISYTGVT